MKLLLNKILRLGAVASLFFFSVFISPSAYSYDVINGNACIAANLGQAVELQWNQARVLNPISNPNTRFVTCTMTSGSKFLEAATLDVTSVESGGVEAYFEAGAASDAQADCIVREMSSITVTNAGVDTVFLEINNPNPGTTDTAQESFSASDDIDINFNIGLFGGEGSARTFTLTCALDPGVGINAYWLIHTLPSTV